jgi:hypothetical protein
VYKRASLDNPEVLLELRRRIIDLVARVRNMLNEANTVRLRAELWLRDERARGVKQQLLKHETRLGEARIALQAVSSRIGNPMARSHETEERNYVQARVQFEQTAVLMENISRWLIKLPRELAGPAGTLQHGSGTIDQLEQQAVAQLDHMIAAIERYHDAGRRPSQSAVDHE